MTNPGAWASIVLVLGTFRLVRLVSYDDFPPIERVRDWALGKRVRAHSRPAGQDDAYVVTYRRPLLAHLLFCPWCVGFWIALAVYVAWLFVPSVTLYVAAPFALSAAIGLLAKNWDP